MEAKHLALSLRSVACAAALFAFSTMAIAADDTNKTLQSTAVQYGTGYFKVVEPLSVNCLYGVIYVNNLSNDAGQRSMFATVLAAQASGLKISRVSYDVDTAGRCTANLVEISQ
ncbi:hypothetical protein [Dyella japonica]|uniref:Uncharacterized protein n=1 Tax=Dyella japonica TaxID=231455 RepID=A0ABV2JNA7_9GAMM